jgi:hypothetical protein
MGPEWPGLNVGRDASPIDGIFGNYGGFSVDAVPFAKKKGWVDRNQEHGVGKEIKSGIEELASLLGNFTWASTAAPFPQAHGRGKIFISSTQEWIGGGIWSLKFPFHDPRKRIWRGRWKTWPPVNVSQYLSQIRSCQSVPMRHSWVRGQSVAVSAPVWLGHRRRWVVISMSWNSWASLMHLGSSPHLKRTALLSSDWTTQWPWHILIRRKEHIPNRWRV